MKYDIVRISDAPHLREKAAQWFHEKWGVPLEAYLESMQSSLCGGAVPSWYVALDGEKIIAGMGVIENDFHKRKDLAPNVCAVYTEEMYRGRGICGRLLSRSCEDMKKQGIETLYLLTDHTSLYERYGWEFFCMAENDAGGTSRMYIHK
ncbi:MAG: GNAT family N-acetyltransferase [Christensenellales bacterium]|jgi:hypothetical protein